MKTFCKQNEERREGRGGEGRGGEGRGGEGRGGEGRGRGGEGRGGGGEGKGRGGEGIREGNWHAVVVAEVVYLVPGSIPERVQYANMDDWRMDCPW